MSNKVSYKEQELENFLKNKDSLVKNEHLIDFKKFSLPDMGDFMGDEFSIEYAKKVQKKINGKEDSKESVKDTLFYVEKPFSTDLGFNDDADVLIIKAKPNINSKNTRTNAYDGDTLYFNIDSVMDGNKNFGSGGEEYKNAKDFLRKTKGIDGVDRSYVEGNKPKTFGIRFLGIDCPEVPKFMEVPEESVYKSKYFLNADIESFGSNFVYEINDINERRKKNKKTLFVILEKGGKWHEVVERRKEYNKELKKDIYIYRICYTDPSKKSLKYAKQAKACQETVREALNKADDMRILIDMNTTSLKGDVPDEYSKNWFYDKNKGQLSNVVDMAQKLWDRMSGYRANMYSGYNAFGMDNYRRFLGVVYLFIEGEWINLSKYVASKHDLVELLPDYTYDPTKESMYGYKSDAFKMWSYNKDQKIVDAMKSINDVDDRNKIQEAIFGRSYESLKDWTVTIGDCTFMVPPTSINLLIASTNERVPLLRSKGSATRSGKKDNRILQLDLYFNDDRGINGYPLDINMPGLKEGDKGSVENIKSTYFMNGLRSLVSMFKFTPFLPIENNYINKNLGIDAVSLISMNVQSIPHMPKTLKATIMLQEFDYRVYMPEIPIPDFDSGEEFYTNLFAKTINYEVMRYYYQRPIVKGEKLVDYPIDSNTYIRETLGSKTALQPMRFTNPYIKFYQLDKNYLSRKHQAFMERERRGMRQLHKPTKAHNNYIKSYLYPKAKEIDRNLKVIANLLAPEDIDIGVNESRIVIPSVERQLSNMPEYVKYKVKTKTLKVGNKEKKIVYPEIYFKFDNHNTSYLQTDTLFKNYAEEIGVTKDSFKDNSIRIPLKPFYDKSNKRVYYALDNSAPGTALIGLILKQGPEGEFKTLGELAQEDHDKTNRHNDIETNLSLKFVEIPTPPIIVTSYSVTMANTFNNLSLQMSNGYAPQYLGGQDIKFDIVIETTDKETVTFLSNLPRDIAMTCREYREILTVYPVRIDTEFTRFFGVNEVVIENVQVNTMNSKNGNLKNNWEIHLSLVSVDRTVRNREALKNISRKRTEEEAKRPNEKVEEEGKALHSGGSSTFSRKDSKEKNFWSLKNMLAEAEVYPDLELPTIYELERHGFKFIRYSKSTSNRVFPDPDFYFYYGHILANEILRTTIQNFLGEEFKNENENLEYEFFDSTGAMVKVKYNDLLPDSFEITDANEAFKNTLKAREELDDAKRNSKRISHRNNSIKKAVKEIDVLDDVIASLTDAVMGENWNICDNISVRFRENYMTDKSLATERNKGELYEKLQDRTKELVDLIDSYLSEKPSLFHKKSSHAYRFYKKKKDKELKDITPLTPYMNVKSISETVWGNFKLRSEYKRFEELLGLRNHNSLKLDGGKKHNIDSIAIALIASIASARTGLYEFDGYKKEEVGAKRKIKDKIHFSDIKGWYHENLKYCLVAGNPQDLTSRKRAITLQEVVENGQIFGRFGIRELDQGEVAILKDNSNRRSSNFLDPYYRNKASEEDLIELKVNLVLNEIAGAEIAFREMLYYIKVLLEEEHLLTVFDMMYEGIDEIIRSEYAQESLPNSQKGNVADPLAGTHFYDADENYEKGSVTTGTFSKYKKIREQESKDEKLTLWGKFKKGVIAPSTDTISHGGKWVMNTVSDSVTYFGYKIKLKADKVTDTLGEEERERIEEYIAYSDQLKQERKMVRNEAKNRRKDLARLKDNLDSTVVSYQAGKLFAGGILAATYGSEQIFELIRLRDYKTLNSIVQEISLNLSGNEEFDEDTLAIRKYVRALAGYEIMANPERIGQAPKNIQQDLINMTMSKIYVKAAEQPLLYLQHSFYDMIVNDKRGRMVRAFPTFYMLFIDEGREIGWWKLHDNFYNMSSITSYQIVKSRKIAADTAIIQMNNMFQTFDRYDDDLKEDDEYTCMDFVRSLFSPRSYYLSEEMKRLQAEEVHKTQLRPGIRTHIRMGYGSNASTLPIVFNGCLTEINQGDIVKLVAQGDGVELTNPLMTDLDAEDLQFQDDLPGWRGLKGYFERGATPKTILSSILTTEGGFKRSSIKKFTKGRLFNDNPYGIVHFGDNAFDDIFPEGETVQNIYEATSKPQWGQGGSSGLPEIYGLNDSPKISLDLFDKTFWDIMHICASTSPDFICGIAPFNFRSTIFLGRPRYYYAYDYIKRDDGRIIEKRKPYQQYHVITSYSDIIKNNMSATEQGVATCAIGSYEREGWMGRSIQDKTDPLWVDINIYPEKQKTMTVDLSLIAKAIPVLNAIPGVASAVNTGADTKGRVQGGKELAFRMTSSALNNNIKDMYRGDIVMIGNPAIKPHDRVYLVDLYERMEGNLGVEAVIHNFSVDTGYTTSVYPDLISTVDDPHEMMNINFIKDIMVKSLGVYIPIVLTSQMFAGNTVPLMTAAMGMVKNGVHSGTNVVNVLAGLFEKDGVTSEQMIKNIGKFEDAIGIPSLASSLNALESDNALGGFNKLSKEAKDLANAKKLSKFSNFYDDISLKAKNSDLSSIINEIDKGAQLGYIDNPDNLREVLEKTNKEIKDITKDTIALSVKSGDLSILEKELLGIVNNPKVGTDKANNAKEIYDSLKGLGKKSGIEQLDTISQTMDFLQKNKSIIGDENFSKLIDINKNLSDNLAKGFGGLKDNLKSKEELKGVLDYLDDIKYKTQPTNFLGTLGAMIIERIVITTIYNCLTGHLSRVMRSHQVLQLYPIKKGGKVLTAGLDGSKGVIVGSPLYNDRGTLQRWIGDLYDYDEWNGLGKIVPMVVNYFSSKGMQQAAEKYKKNGNLDRVSKENVEFLNRSMQYVTAEEIRKQNAYHGAIVTPRVLNYKTKENKLTEQGKMWFHRAAVLKTDNLEKNPIISNSTIPIEKHKNLKSAIDEGLLVLSHNTQDGSINRHFNISGENVSLNCIEKNNTVDIPVLREDAILLLNEIVSKIRLHLNPNSLTFKSKVQKHPIIIQSAFVAGAKNLSSTGLNFTFTATNLTEIEDLLNQVIEEQREIFNNKSYGEMKYFTYSKKNNTNTTYKIEVLPPYSMDTLNENLESVK